MLRCSRVRWVQVAIERSPVVAAIAERLNASPVAVVLRWTLARNVVIIPRTANPDKIVENITVGAWSNVSHVLFATIQTRRLHDVAIVSGLSSEHNLLRHFVAPTLELSEDDMAKLDALNEARPYYWCPLPLVKGSTPDV